MWPFSPRDSAHGKTFPHIAHTEHHRRPRVAVVYTHFPHYRNPVFKELASSCNYDFYFFYDRKGVDPTIISGDGLSKSYQIRAFRFRSLMFQPGFFWTCVWRNFDAFIFLGNPYILTTWLYAAICKIRNKKVVFWTHGWIKKKEGRKGWVRSVFYLLSDMLMLYGDRAKEIGISKGFSLKRIQVIYNSLDYPAQMAIRESRLMLDRSIDAPYFLCVSRLVPEVNLTIAIEALALFPKDSLKSVFLVIVGDGPERAALEQAASRLAVSVIFLSAVYDEQRLADLFMNCVAVVSPGKVGLLAIHALAYGVPVITHDCLDHQMPEIEAIIPGRTGSLYQHGNVHDLARAMLHHLHHERTDAEIRDAIRVIEDKYTPAVQCKLIEQGLERLGV